MLDPFAILGLPRQFDLDTEDLHRRYIQASARTHPDRFRDPLDQADAAEQSATINEAHRLLSDPAARADALLQLIGGPGKSDDKSLPADLLMEMMEIREEMEQAIAADDAATLARLRVWANDEKAKHLQRIADLFTRTHQDPSVTETTLKQIRLELNALRYVQRMLEQMPTE
jgi:molecular chaperone HscB